MLSGFGIFGGFIGVVMCIWFIHVGFLAKQVLKEQQETNYILRQMSTAGSVLRIVSNVA